MPSSMQRVDSQRMAPRRDEARQKVAPGAQPAHVGAQQNGHRDGSRAHDQLQKLQPDDLVDQRRAAARGEQNQEDGEQAPGHN